MVKIMDAVNAIFRSACAAVLPHRLVRSAISIDGDQNMVISATGSAYPLRKNVYVAAFGKAACGMSRAVDDILHDHIADGVVSMPKGTVEVFRRHALTDLLPRADSALRYHEGAAHNLPDENSQRAAVEVRDMLGRLTKDDLLLVLISGGGSALLPLPVPGISLEEKTALIKLLSQRGAAISELNTVRQHLSQLKGGRMAQLASHRAQRIVSLNISDIIGDPLEFIASGPTVPRTTEAADAVAVIRKYQGGGAEETCVRKAIDVLENGNHGTLDSVHWDRVDNIIIGNSRIALEGGLTEAKKLSFQAEIVNSSVTGEAKDVGREYARRMDQLLSSAPTGKHCWLWGGETTVRVKRPGRGGRNQEMVLAFAEEAVQLRLVERYVDAKFSFLSAGTDGQDGPTDAAGAFINNEHLKSMTPRDVEYLGECLEKNDSYAFLSKFLDGACHIKCGLTGTNVMDVQIITIE